MTALNRLLTILSRRQDLIFVGLLVTTIGVMILPVPPAALDVLIALNLALTAVILLVAVYLDRSTSFSTFPTVILLATTFRLAISISTTRSVLSSGDGGEIVNTFGRFVTAGNVTIGLVIFLIISIVQFIVVTKGSERVAEVAARFILDALPGRQMSIDAELRSGDITPDEARRRRQLIDKENQFFGAMDGAMKFVKGDAITGLLIVAVNLIGGLAIGVAQGHMSLADATATYSLLTIGDGLVAQIPALLIAMSAGLIITRVTSTDTDSNLGTDIVTDLTRSHRSLMVAGVVIAALGLVPGFPMLIFFGFGGAIAAFAFAVSRAANEPEVSPEAEAQAAAEATLLPSHGDRLVVAAGEALANSLAPAAFRQAQARHASLFEDRFGLAPPAFGLVADPTLADDEVVISFDGVPLATAHLPADAILALADDVVLDLAEVEALPATSLRLGTDHVRLVPAALSARLAEAHIPTQSREEAIVRFALAVTERLTPSLVGFDLVQSMLRTLRTDYAELADQISATVATARILDVMRRLAAEQVPLKPARVLFEAIAEWAPRQQDPDILTEYVRRRLAAQICHGLADEDRTVPVYVVEPDFEQALRGCLRATDTGAVLALTAGLADRLLAEAAGMRKPLDPTAPRPVILTSPDLRRHVRTYLVDHEIETPVLSHAELATEFRVSAIGSLSLSDTAPARAA